METWRLFIAIALGSAARDAFVAAQGALHQLALPVRWVDPAGAHLTLKFLGDVDRQRIATIERALRAIAARRQRFSLRTAGPGAFPNTHRPRVLWLGLTGDHDRLGALQSAVDDALFAAGFPREQRPFHPHLTLGRVQRDQHHESQAGLEAIFASVRWPAPAILPVTAVRLMRSELGRGGARYTTLLEVPLGGAPHPAAPE